MRNHLRMGAIFFMIILSVEVAADDSAENVLVMTASSRTYLYEPFEIISETIRFVTAYNAGDPNQTEGDPCISASGENLCDALESGEKRCAANFVPLGTALFIENYGRCLVTDRTNSRYRNRVDIAMQSDELKKAKQFGKQKLTVKILGTIQPISY